MSNQRFAKNNNRPPEDSVLWQIGENWKISAQSGRTYTNLDNITYDPLKQELENVIDLPPSQWDYISGYNPEIPETEALKGNWFFPTLSDDNILVWGFEDESLVSEFVESKKRYASKGNSGFSSNGGKSTTGKPFVKKSFGNKPSFAGTQTKLGSNNPVPAPIPSQEQYIATYFDPQPVEYNAKDKIEELLAEGYIYLPHYLAGDKTCFENKDKILCFLMGKIIKVKLTDNT